MSIDDTLRKTASQFFVHSPADLSQSYVDWAERLQNDPGIDYGCILDKHIIPLHPGDLMAVVARPGHGKTSWMAYMTKRVAEQIVKRGDDEAVAVYVTWEQTVEEIEAYFQSVGHYSSTDMAWGKVPLDKIKARAVKRGNVPIWVFGESKRHEGVKRPKMKIEYVYAAIESMYEDYGKRPALLCLDYVQIMPVSAGQDKTGQVDEAIRQAKELAIRVGLPVIIGVQAARRVDTYTNQIPTMSDAQWSSSIEQIADKQLAIWRPVKSHDPGDKPEINIGGTKYANDEDLFVIRLLKQRFGVGYGAWAVRFRPQTLELYDYKPTAA
jgi:replicative DNA helicase